MAGRNVLPLAAKSQNKVYTEHYSPSCCIHVIIDNTMVGDFSIATGDHHIRSASSEQNAALL